MSRALLIGNGVNRVNKDIDWESLVKSLYEGNGHPYTELERVKPLPLKFMEVVHLGKALNGGYSAYELAIKKQVAEKVDALVSTDLHSKLMTLDFQEVITTNYDASLISESFKNTSIQKETTYSIFRRFSYESKNVWFAHGKSDVPNSITLGLVAYLGYVNKLHDYLKKGVAVKRDGKDVVLQSNYKELNHIFQSWSDVFIKSEVHVVGFSFDFEEKDFWYLLDWRRKNSHLIPNQGRIIHYEIKLQNRNDFESNLINYYSKFRRDAVLSMLKSFGVEVVEITSSSYEEGYDMIANRLSN